MLLQSWRYHTSFLNFSSTLFALCHLSPQMFAFCLLCSASRWFLSTSHLTDAINDHSIRDLSCILCKNKLALSNLPPGGKHFDTQLPRRDCESTMAILHIGQFQTLSTSATPSPSLLPPPTQAGHRAGALNTASFPGTNKNYGNEVGLAEIRRVASRELTVKVGSGTKTIWIKQQIPQRLGRLSVRRLAQLFSLTSCLHDFAGIRGPGWIQSQGGVDSPHSRSLWWLSRRLSLSTAVPLLEELYFKGVFGAI